jgi:chemotaxis protein MotB
LGDLQDLLDDARARDEGAEVEIATLGAQLNQALARVAVEERKRRAAEEAENEILAAEKKALQEDRARLEIEKAELEAKKAELESQNTELESETETLARFRSEFFGRLRDVLGAQDGVRISGDRFVFASEVLFAPGAAELSAEGQAEVAKVADILRTVASDIPSEINWIIRVDGHTDNVPLSGLGAYADNWELSQARALSVVRFMSDQLGISPTRLAANGFGEFQPLTTEDTPEARAQNRRIELKFTEK